MKKIILIGAGRSAGSLIDYLVENAAENQWELVIADREIEPLKKLYSQIECIQLIKLNVNKEEDRKKIIASADMVISMLPASFHIQVAKDCILFKKNMLTASYISEEMKALDAEAKKAGVLILNEMGVDPGIDHLSAMKAIDEIKERGGKLKTFETFTGGLVAPEHDDNPWNYKFTWNPRNVVLAGQGGAVKFIQEGSYKFIPYHKVFRRTEVIEIDDYGKFEGIANRDSLKYRTVYGLEDIETMYRGTLRRPGFCRSWDAFVQLGATDDSYVIPNSEEMTFREFINLFLPYNPHDSVELKFCHYLNIRQDDTELFSKLKWLDIFESIPIGIKNATPAQVLQKILERKWTLKKNEKDMIVMWHKFIYEIEGQQFEKHASMVVKGKDQKQTAMAMTVGYPLAIATKMMMQEKIQLSGVRLPLFREIYSSVLTELEDYGICFKEKEFAFTS